MDSDLGLQGTGKVLYMEITEHIRLRAIFCIQSRTDTKYIFYLTGLRSETETLIFLSSLCSAVFPVAVPWNVDPDPPPQDEVGGLLPLPAGLPGPPRRGGLQPRPQPAEEADYSQ